ncbi:MAG: branched-chain amino acid ABC transporter permease [Rhizobiaceae bacterium]
MPTLFESLRISTGMINNFLAMSLLTYSVYLSMRAGIFSVAGVAFGALGGYVAGNIAMAGGGAVPALAAATGISAVIGVALSVMLRRIRRLYLTMATFAFVLLTQVLVKNGGDLTGGQYGLFGIPKLLGTSGLLATVAMVGAFVYLLERGVFGRTFEALRTDEQLARTMGIDVAFWRGVTFTLSAALGGLAGSANALQIGLVTPDAAGFEVIVDVLTILVVGGTGAWYGPILGTFVVVWLPELLSFSGEWRTIVQGLIVIAIVVYAPNGAVGLIGRIRLPRIGRTSADPQPQVEK